MNTPSNSITIRFTEESDQKYVVDWLMQPGVLRWFPLYDLREVEDAVRIIMTYTKYQGVLTALLDGVPVGVASLYLQPYRKLAHQCLFVIIVDENARGKGVGTKLMEELMVLAKERFKIELLHLEVYEENPAIRFYERLGFSIYGRHKKFIKENGRYRDKILMQRGLNGRT